jgi:hypothetical protein
MKKEDYNQLKKLCDDNGFELLTQSPFENGKYFVVKKKPEKVKVDFTDYHYPNDFFSDSFSISFRTKNLGERDYKEIGKFLAQQLEQYLNEKQK